MTLPETDKYGRPSVKDGKFTYCVIVKKPFKEYLEQRGTNYGIFLSLKPHEKEKIFLRWKWGFTNDNTNHDLELSRKTILGMTKDVNDYYFDNMRKFEGYCDRVKREMA